MTARHHLLLALLATFWAAANADGASKSKNKPKGGASTAPVDAILDRLERRLLDEEEGGLTFAERKGAARPSSESITKYGFASGTTIQAKPKSEADLTSIETVVSDLETQVDQLASAVQKAKQGILDDAAIDNYFILETQLTDTDQANLKVLNIKIDGFRVYELSDASGLWLPAKAIQVYSGPLQPGSHRIDVEARLTLKAQGPAPVQGEVSRLLTKSFDLIMTAGATSARWVLAIKPPTNLEQHPDAVLKQVL